MTVDDFFDGFEESRSIFDTLQKAIERLGPAGIRVSKSQVAFIGTKTFAIAWIPGKYLRGSHAPLVLTLRFKARHYSPRFKEIVQPAPRKYIHHMELFSEADIDSEVLDLLREAISETV